MSNITRRAFAKSALALLGGVMAAQKVAAASHSTSHTVTISNFAFSPATLEIGVGDTVVFVNQDGAPHTATATNGAFDTGRLGSGASASLGFNSAGQYDYFCAVHPRMTGSITVRG
jgi:plastocyanin